MNNFPIESSTQLLRGFNSLLQSVSIYDIYTCLILLDIDYRTLDTNPPYSCMTSSIVRFHVFPVTMNL